MINRRENLIEVLDGLSDRIEAIGGNLDEVMQKVDNSIANPPVISVPGDGNTSDQSAVLITKYLLSRGNL